MSVYQNEAVPKHVPDDVEYLGCFEDDPRDRALTLRATSDASGMSYQVRRTCAHTSGLCSASVLPYAFSKCSDTVPNISLERFDYVGICVCRMRHGVHSVSVSRHFIHKRWISPAPYRGETAKLTRGTRSCPLDLRATFIRSCGEECGLS